MLKMDEESDETCNFPSPNSCCPVGFLNASPSPGRTPAADGILSYDMGLLRQGQTVVDIPWGQNLTIGVARDQDSEEKLEVKHGSVPCCSEQGRLNCWKENTPSRSFCGVICNPLLTSRLALTGLLAVLLIVMTVLTWVLTSTNVQQSVRSVTTEFRHELLLRTKDTADALLQGNNASSASLARFLSSLSQGNLSSFSSLQNQISSALFLVFSVLSGKAQVTYFGGNGVFISYVADSSGISVIYANSSYLYPSSAKNNEAGIPWKAGENLTLSRPWYNWYRQTVDEITGLPNGEATLLTPLPYWGLKPVQSSLQGQDGVSSFGFSLPGSRGVYFSSLSPVRESPSADPIGAVAVAVSVTDIQDLFDQFDRQGGDIYLATADGRLVAQTGTPFYTYGGDNGTQVLPFATDSNNAVVAGAAQYLTTQLPDKFDLRNESFMAFDIYLQGTRYMVDGAPVQLAGATLVCVVIIPYKSLWGSTQKRNHTTLAVLVALATCMGLVGCFFVVLLTKGVSNEMRLRAALIQQLEATKRAETKSSHKSLVFANMSHDLRTPLAAILGLIDLCLCDVSECSELEANLLQMKSCATNLLGILNSILDMSKIEAGKLLLQESDFDLVSALEEIVDTFSVVGLKKGLEVVLDLSDGTVEKAPWVVGDVGRVKQIISNLLSNGVKFTAEGHVVLRAWVKPVGMSTVRPGLCYRGRLLTWPWSHFLRSPSREKEICKLIQGLSERHHDEDHVQIEFEVDDTGRGIPKERWKAVFENFVQVESSVPRNYDGTGLGLGIVRSLVRLMGGDINIIDKDEPGEPGTRFRFNLTFKCNKQHAKHGGKQVQDISLRDRASLQATFGVNSTSVSPSWHLDSSDAPVLSHGLDGTGFASPPIAEGVHVLLAMQGQAGKRIVKRWMERRGLQVWTIGNWEEFASTVERIKQDIFSESFSTSERFGLISPESHMFDSWVDDLDAKGFSRARTSTDASLHPLPPSDCGSTAELNQKLNAPGARAHLLLIIDVTMVTVPLDSLCSELEDILLELDRPAMFKVVWLVNANTPSADIQYLKRQISVCNLILHKPLYASRLQCTWVLIQELVDDLVWKSREGEGPRFSSVQRESVDLGATNSPRTSLSCIRTLQEETGGELTAEALDVADKNGFCFDSSTVNPTHLDSQVVQCQPHSDIVLQDSRYPLSGRTNIERWSPPLTPDQSPLHRSPENVPLPRARSRGDELMGPHHALSAMHILVAEDNPVLQRLTKTRLVRLGATVECVDNGAEAARLVLENLYKSKVSPPEEDEKLSENLSQQGTATRKNQPFDLVLMDCEMPILNGYEATQRIRSEESRYGFRTPVIALTAHAMAQDEKKCIEAGMDFYLTKPLAIDALLDVVSKIIGARTFENT